VQKLTDMKFICLFFCVFFFCTSQTQENSNCYYLQKTSTTTPQHSKTIFCVLAIGFLITATALSLAVFVNTSQTQSSKRPHQQKTQICYYLQKNQHTTTLQHSKTILQPAQNKPRKLKRNNQHSSIIATP
jgi:hypothetical protein